MIPDGGTNRKCLCSSSYWNCYQTPAYTHHSSKRCDLCEDFQVHFAPFPFYAPPCTLDPAHTLLKSFLSTLPPCIFQIWCHNHLDKIPSTTKNSVSQPIMYRSIPLLHQYSDATSDTIQLIPKAHMFFRFIQSRYKLLKYKTLSFLQIWDHRCFQSLNSAQDHFYRWRSCKLT